MYTLSKKLILFLILTLSNIVVRGQFSLNGQLRTRTEVRDGLGNLPLVGAKPAAFTSQRTRLIFGYKWDRVTFNTSIQDVRVWGQDAASINNADGGRLMVHEANAEVVLANVADTTIKFKAIQNLSLKIGRQELVYDDVRLLGNLDWLQQARRFDAILLKGQHLGWLFDLGGGFNQNTDAFGVNGTFYTPGNVPASVLSSKNVSLGIPAGFIPTAGKGGAPILATPLSTNGQNQQFKAFQMLYVTRKFKQTKVSGLFFKDDFSKYISDSIGNANQGYVYGRRYNQAGVNSRMTYGLMLNNQFGNASSVLGKIQSQAWFYAQSGKDRDGLTIKNAYHYGAFFTIQKGNLSFGPGYEVLTGNNTLNPTPGQISKFDPLYGTPHKHWGYMDYFYVGTGSAAGGLKDGYLKAKYLFKLLTFNVEAHTFSLEKTMANKLDNNKLLDKNLGTEIDFLLNINMNKFTNIELGYSYMKGNNTLEYAKSSTIDKTRKNGNWAYLMINIRPDFFYNKPVAIKQ